ncbi:unnamed protein product [Trichobilharzia regenti]|nr:unnamed protein product [Trichobilharzia regenti]
MVCRDFVDWLQDFIMTILWPSLKVPLSVVRPAYGSVNGRFFPYRQIRTEAVFSIEEDTCLPSAESVERAFEVGISDIYIPLRSQWNMGFQATLALTTVQRHSYIPLNLMQSFVIFYLSFYVFWFLIFIVLLATVL